MQRSLKLEALLGTWGTWGCFGDDKAPPWDYLTAPVFQQGGLDQGSETGMKRRVGEMAQSLLRHHGLQ